MILKGIVDTDFINYKEISMYIAFPYCNFKCEKDCGVQCCQNRGLAVSPDVEYDANLLLARYFKNPLTKAIVLGGLEPFDSFPDMYLLIYRLRNLYQCNDTVVIYTGYTEDEVRLSGWYDKLAVYPNIIVKFGRYNPYDLSHKDDLLGVELASDNQYAKLISKENKE